MSARRNDHLSLDLFVERPVTEAVDVLSWPDPSRFPLNSGRDNVRDVVLADLKRSSNPLIIAGYASLDQLVDFITECKPTTVVRVLFGFEPFAGTHRTYEVRGHSFPSEVANYWLKRGVSLLLSAKLIRCIQRVKDGEVLARYISDPKHRLHAKVYVGDDAATVGSSNFTANGLGRQLEANARFALAKDAARYKELRAIAENLWKIGVDYSRELIELLEALLRVVTWREALARACAELLEGDWAAHYLRTAYLPGEGDLWPSQRQGIAQALYVLSRNGSALVADATGSGKTRMGVHLIRAAAEDIMRSGRLRKGKALMICPPAIKENWELEATLSGTALDVVSHGSLSHAGSTERERTIEALRRAQILCVDEGHNFLNLSSNRTQHLLRNMADHVLLFTATPINRTVVDLLRIADMLGADNLEPRTVKAFQRILGAKEINRTLSEDELDLLRGEIQKFTVRRTKRMLNERIAEDPDAYTDGKGRPCRFPTHVPCVYSMQESQTDRQLAAKVRELADGLFAVTHFLHPIEMPETLRRRRWSEESYLNTRLRSAKKIAGYMIMAALRSSRLALAEHVAGTKAAVEMFGLTDFHKSSPTGDQLSRLRKLGGELPANRLSVPLPDWLSDSKKHAAACEHDYSIYRDILELVQQMSDGRERTKAEQLVKLATVHPLVLAFDSRPITLAEIRRQIALISPAQHIMLATGELSSQRSKLLDSFRPGSDAKGIIGLCSDSLAEGVNLQQASCMMHLDMPSVVRIAEQRAGRVDRMDSPHERIEAWWPDDAPEFALSSDERFVERYETVESLLGSNMPLPESMQIAARKPLSTHEIIREYENEAQTSEWDGIHDAFAPVRELVAGDQALVDHRTYDYYRKQTARVLSRVSVVKAKEPWAFFALAGGTFRAPHWVLFPSVRDRAVTDLTEVCAQLRDRLTEDVVDLHLDDHAARHLAEFVRRLSGTERELLPRRKQRALEEMQVVLAHFVREAAQEQDQETVEHYRAILTMLEGSEVEHQPDWDEVASRWLDLIRPTWYEKLKQPRKKPLQLKDIRHDLIKEEKSLRSLVLAEFRSFPVMSSPDERISACIIGTPF